MGPKLKRNHETVIDTEPTTTKVTSIRKRILQRVLPVALLPLLLLSLFTIGGIFLLQRQTADAVGSAEEVLTEEVVEDGVTRASERAARDLAEYVDQWVFRSNRLNDTAEFRKTVTEVSVDVSNAQLNPADATGFENALTGPLTTRTRVLALTLREQLRTFEEDENLQVLLVSEDGYTIGGTNEDSPLDHSQELWFQRAKETGLSFRTFVNDGDGPAAFELAFWTQAPANVDGGAVLRVRVAMNNVQWILDEIAADDAVTVSLVDTSESVLLADTGTQHSAAVMFDQGMLMSDQTGLNRELLAEGTVQNDVTVTAARRVADRMDNEANVAFNWLTQTNQSLEVAGGSLADVRAVSDNVAQLRQFLVLGVVAFLLLASLLAFIAIRSVASQITKPIKVLSDQARDAAGEGIPAIVEAARTSEDLPDLPEFDVDSNDEIAILAHSMNTMQEAAVDLAAGQAKLRRQNVARTFVSLGRRNQNLLNRQLEFITELEQQEQDADLLESLFRLDHLATRMRRNAENLLVLAGEQTPRRWGRPIAIRDVLRAAASEIADYPRVRLGDIDAATVSGGLATDLSHLIAELLENAGSFSPPNTPIEVLGQHTSTHYRLAIVDQGIGMDPQALAQVNDRLKNPVDFADAPSAYLGLFVVGRLAQEMGITVRLASADPTGEGRRRGTIAFVDLPVALLSSETAAPIELEGSDGVARRTGEVDAAQTAGPAATPAPAAPAVAPAAPVPQALPTPTPAPVSEETTAAGFPKRSRGATSVPSSPVVMTPSKPAEAEPAAAAPAAAAPTAPATEITAAGFPKRGSSSGTAPAPQPAAAPATAGEAAAPIKRDAANVSNSLRSIREAVARGRATGQAQTAMPNPSVSTPPVPIAPVVPEASPPPAAAPQQAAPQQDAAPQPSAVPQHPTTQPTHPTGSE